jgi:hypothetical protein
MTANQSVTLQNDLNWLQKWELEWDMKFNLSKCQVIHVAKRKHPIPTQYYLHGVHGVDISENLTWDAHIDKTSKKANQILGFLCRNIKVKS